jgi:hypothetical protein
MAILMLSRKEAGMKELQSYFHRYHFKQLQVQRQISNKNGQLQRDSNEKLRRKVSSM